MTEDRNRLSTRDIAKAAADRRDRVDDRTPATPSAVPVVAPAVTEASRTRAEIRTLAADEAGRDSLFHDDETQAFRTRWEAIQTGFVDEPRAAVEQADGLVAQVVTRLAEVFSEERSALGHQWDRGDNISTEDLRVALRRYRSFFDRLLSV
jgi:hypothetical protein